MKKFISLILSMLIILCSFCMISLSAYADDADTADSADPCGNAKINVAVAKDFDYRTKITIKATASDVPAGYFLAIYVGTEKAAEQEGSGNGITEVSYYAGELRDNINYTVKIIDAAGNVQIGSSGKALSKDAGTVKCVKSLKTIIVGFFKGLFGTLPERTVQPESANSSYVNP